MLRGALEPWHIIIIVALLFVLFGAKRMPDASRSLARSMKIFKSEVKDLRSDDDPETPEITAASTTTTPAAPTAPVAGATAAPVVALAKPAPTSSAAANAAELRAAELRLAELRVDELRAQNAATAQREHDRV